MHHLIILCLCTIFTSASGLLQRLPDFTQISPVAKCSSSNKIVQNHIVSGITYDSRPFDAVLMTDILYHAEPGMFFAHYFPMTNNSAIYIGLQPRTNNSALVVFSYFGKNGFITNRKKCTPGADGGKGISCSLLLPKYIVGFPYRFTLVQRGDKYISTIGYRQKVYRIADFKIERAQFIGSTVTFAEYYKPHVSCSDVSPFVYSPYPQTRRLTTPEKKFVEMGRPRVNVNRPCGNEGKLFTLLNNYAGIGPTNKSEPADVWFYRPPLNSNLTCANNWDMFNRS